MGGVKLESVHCVKDLGVTISSNLKFSQHCKEAACKTNKMLGFINRNFSFKNKDIILPMYISLVRLHLEYAVIRPDYLSLVPEVTIGVGSRKILIFPVNENFFGKLESRSDMILCKNIRG